MRQYFPKGTALSRWNRNGLDAIATALNGWPRKTLDWKTPAEALDEHPRSLHRAGVATTGRVPSVPRHSLARRLAAAELIRHRRPWKNIDDLEIAVDEYTDWFDHQRLHDEIGLFPPAE